MESEYDRKFEAMKSYIPFLESTINNLTLRSGSENPRQAQLSKIKALRDILLDKKKRMKMDNLLKCEQVLINLYAKLENRDSFPGIQNASQKPSPQTSKAPEKVDLDVARNKLKNVVKIEKLDDTLPEIARANQTDIDHTLGSKEPALFQRRPNKDSTDVSNKRVKDMSGSTGRNYTRVLISPDRSEHKTKSDQLFHRRSPTKKSSPRDVALSYKDKKSKDRKKNQRSFSNSEADSSIERKVNITLKVPEDSLSSLNTENIFDRIINCDNTDVDINTLRELRKQILGELKQTGSKDDISELIIKSCKKANKKKREDVEEGELSDSESEAIENIYGNLVFLENQNEKNDSQNVDKATETRKIQIRLVISNPEKNVNSNDFDIVPNKKDNIAEVIEHNEQIVPRPKDITNFSMEDDVAPEVNLKVDDFAVEAPTNAERASIKSQSESSIKIKESGSSTIGIHTTIEKEAMKSTIDQNSFSEGTLKKRQGNMANFYKPSTSIATKESPNIDQSQIKNNELKVNEICQSELSVNSKLIETKSGSEIPFLNEEKHVKEDAGLSEIDILQALKNEILSEFVPGTEIISPSLHEPKITKVTSVKEVITKKTISFEKYKLKTTSSMKPVEPIFPSRSREDASFKISGRGLTAKECERFNYPVSINDSSDEDIIKINDSKDYTEDLAPKSPDIDIFSEVGKETPKIIPEEPIEPQVLPIKDVDMREIKKTKKISEQLEPNLPRPVDPRKRKENFNESVNLIPSGIITTNYNSTINVPPLMSPDDFSTNDSFSSNYIPNMTPNRITNTPSLDATPSRQSFESDDCGNRRHVYVPLMSRKETDMSDLPHERIDQRNVNRWEGRSHSVMRDDNIIDQSYFRENKYNSRPNNAGQFLDRRNDQDRRKENVTGKFYTRHNHLPGASDITPTTPSHPFGRADNTPTTPIHPFGRADIAPTTPSHPFGRSEGSMTPVHPFGQSDVTPNHPFGRGDIIPSPKYSLARGDALVHAANNMFVNDCPMTPSHPFGKAEMLRTPSHPFGRNDMPVTPSHPFGRSDCQSTPNHHFGRSDSTEKYQFERRYSKDNRYNIRGNDEDHAISKGRSSQHHRNSNYDIEQYKRYPRTYDYEPNYLRKNEFNNFNSRDSYDQEIHYENHRESRSYRRERHNESHNSQYGEYIKSSDYQRSSDRAEIRFNEVGNRRNFVETQNTNYNRNSRAQSVGRLFCNAVPEKTVSVESHAGRSFTIDTSVNRTFQELINAQSDIRRKRASSVCRPLPRDDCAGKSLSSNIRQRPNFQRAHSVGRNLLHKDTEKSFTDIKADFEAYKNSESYTPKKSVVLSENTLNSAKPGNDNNLNAKTDSKTKKCKDPRTKQPERNRQNSKEEIYSPSNNNRDPRLKRDSKSRYKSVKDKDSDHNPKQGIAYTNDNIAKGAILGQGYGVKNYRIPKIKRLEQEVDQGTKIVENEEKNNELNIKDKCDKKEKTQIKNSPKHKTDQTKPDSKKKTDVNKLTNISVRKNRINVINDSDSDDNIQEIECAKSKKNKSKELKHRNVLNNDLSDCSDKVDVQKVEESTSANSEINQDRFVTSSPNKNENDFESLELPEDVFSDNFIPGTEFSNISDLIANLDKEIENKQEDPKMTQDQIFDSLVNRTGIADSTNTENEVKNVDSVNKKTEDVDETQSFVDHEILQEKELHLTGENIDNKNSEVSTSESEHKTTIQKSENTLDKNDEVTTTPDSTMNADEIIENICDETESKLPDSSTTETRTENNTDCSTLESKQNSNTDIATISGVNKMDSLGSILSLLKDKSKIKELLCMLDDQDNEKIKKKLEKLSEIVSDDDEDEDSYEPKKVTDISNQQKSPNKLNKQKNQDDFSTDVDNKEESVNEDDIPIASTISKRTTNKRGNKKKPKLKNKVVKPKCNTSKRITRSKTAINQQQNITKKKRGYKTELQQLQEDIRDMFISDEVLKATGIRMCRLKMPEERNEDKKDEENKPIKEVELSEPAPVVVLKKIINEVDSKPSKTKKKPGKPKQKGVVVPTESKQTSKVPPINRPGPKSRTKHQDTIENDPYEFDSDSKSDSFKLCEVDSNCSSETEEESLASLKSFGSSELLVEVKAKQKKKRGGWKMGVIKNKRTPKTKGKISPAISNKKSDTKQSKEIISAETIKTTYVPDLNCFTDKNYCFIKDAKHYSCRLCECVSDNIVDHYKWKHPHYEIPMSRMNIKTANEAIKQSMVTNFDEVKNMSCISYTCRFCYKEFNEKVDNALEIFFWHVVSTHTGEYKQKCSECLNETQCTFLLDIPSLPKENQGLLIGYLCGRCNYAQVSLENLKNHVSLRHNDEETEVYTISMSTITHTMVEDKTSNTEKTDTPCSLRAQKSCNFKERAQEIEKGIKPKTRSVQSLITFENEDENDVYNAIKLERPDVNSNAQIEKSYEDFDFTNKAADRETLVQSVTDSIQNEPTTDVFLEPHFKISYTKAGTKEYHCCINGNGHYKTTLLISLKKHIQIKHKKDFWDGYCVICKVILKPQGRYSFSECLSHLVDVHVDNFPTLEVEEEEEDSLLDTPASQNIRETVPSPRPYIAVRPIADLLPVAEETQDEVPVPMPKIESVISLNSEVSTRDAGELEATINNYHNAEGLLNKHIPSDIVSVLINALNYEKHLHKILSKKNPIVLEMMMTPEKLVQVFKCSGPFCSFTSDTTVAALQHATIHQKQKSEDALFCCYCSFETSGNAIDLVSHVFKEHGNSKFACKACFYRGYSEKLVEDHYARDHGQFNEGIVLQATTNSTLTNTDQEGLLTREIVVKHLVCLCNDSQGQKCKFRTYTFDLFNEHIKNNHGDIEMLACAYCDAEIHRDSLANHMKEHKIALFQCTWCVHGADSESEMISHCSAKHPTKRPQAYLRQVVGKKEEYNVSKMKVLPFVSLTMEPRFKPVAVAVTRADDPAKEADRAVQLETLLGAQHMFTPATADPPPTPVTALDEHSSRTRPVKTSTPPQSPAQTDDTTTHTLMIEPDDRNTIVNKKEEDIVCVSSDEEGDGTSRLIDLSDEPAGPATAAPPAPSAPPPPAPSVTPQPPTPSVTPQPPDTSVTPQPPDTSEVVAHSDTAAAALGNSSSKSTITTSNVTNVDSAITPKDKPDAADTVIDKFKCGMCGLFYAKSFIFKRHLRHVCLKDKSVQYQCAHCDFQSNDENLIVEHYQDLHVRSQPKSAKSAQPPPPPPPPPAADAPRARRKRPSADDAPPPAKTRRYGPDDLAHLPPNQIFDSPAQCELCGFSSKVRLNMVRHLQQHADRQRVPSSAPVNPVPHLQTNEMHFDRMVNLAASSGAAGRYPRYVPDRERYACGARGCDYISIDEAMLRCHWDALHAGVTDFRCVHCPPNQQLDTSRPLTAGRIVAHLKMHEARLYGCSVCGYYHYQPGAVARHVAEQHGGAGDSRVVRSEPAPGPAPPTMDLKPWRCGLCDFTDMLRQPVAEHCALVHNSKFQYKCCFCPWRSSTPENVTKHMGTSHAGRAGEVVYIYYREGSLPAGARGAPPPPAAPDLNLVKPERVSFGPAVEPAGARYRCSLCALTLPDKDDMQSHLYEELRYRKWGCSECSYKAFHQKGLRDHAAIEHRKDIEPIELTTDHDIETWVAGQIEHQEAIIKGNFPQEQTKQQATGASKSDSHKAIDAPSTSVDTPSTSVQTPSTSVDPPPTSVDRTSTSVESSEALSDEELETLFGPCGSRSGDQFACPKCEFKADDSAAMGSHLEAEVAHVRWSCGACGRGFTQQPLAAQHCGAGGARLVGGAARAAWVRAGLRRVRKRKTRTDSDDDHKYRNVIKCPHCTFTTYFHHSAYIHELRHYGLKPYRCAYCPFNGHSQTVDNHVAKDHPGKEKAKVRVTTPDEPPTCFNLVEVKGRPST